MDDKRVKVGALVDIASKRLSISMMTGIAFALFNPFIATRTGSFDQFVLPISVRLWRNSIDFDTVE